MVNFENGTLVKGAYVVINGTEYPVYMPEYTGDTPITAENLNKIQTDLQTNIENAIEGQDSTDANGWYKVEHTGYTEYFKKGVQNVTINGNEWGSSIISLNLPADFVTLGNNAFLTSSCGATDGAVDTLVRCSPTQSKIHISAKNQYGSAVTTDIVYQLRIIKFD